ncbi:MAG: hypothetical protein WED01_01995 [Candidatus Rokuibacteriota bacterium]
MWGRALILSLLVVAPAHAASMEDLLFDLELVPLDGRTPAAISLERLADGKTVSLANLKGRAVLLYFWATW